ncbi:GNAT family N-acetyltransferase [Microbacterium invictum]|uniref:RimJ/RimL family protein N-acetyltransferase n=1 Tax=Microbacterium invictum TaxID=515415 RepID=A0AA40VP05_9MICO|nr:MULTISPECIES: GNAT family N-acetyltransferase [Microbacterium]MBB4141377.1 RimJ/RimL family protein N-acetyltransferase [Microbacterium invictum]
MGHIDLRDLEDDDLDAVFEMMRDPEAIAVAAFTADDPDDRDAFDAWIAGERASDEVELLTVTDRGGFAGTAALFTVEGDREVSFWVKRGLWGHGVATAALRMLVAREAVRPLFGRVAAHNAAGIAVFEHNGFTELSRTTSYAPGLGRDAEVVLYTLAPALDGF